MRHDSSGTLDGWANTDCDDRDGARRSGIAQDEAVKRALDRVVAMASFAPAAPAIPAKQVP